MSLRTPLCGQSRLDASGFLRTCQRDPGHTGHHEDARGDRWEPPGLILDRLRRRWGRSHRIVWTGRFWVATAYDRCAPWRTEIEYSPEVLEERLRNRGATPAIPSQRRRA